MSFAPSLSQKSKEQLKEKNKNFSKNLLTSQKRNDTIITVRKQKQNSKRKRCYIMTRAEIFRNIATIEAVAENEEFVNALLKEAESLEKRAANRVGKQTKVQKENVEIKDRILVCLEENGEAMTATEVANAVNITLAKATALLTQLVKAEKVERAVEKKVARFSIR